MIWSQAWDPSTGPSRKESCLWSASKVEPKTGLLGKTIFKRRHSEEKQEKQG